MPTLSPNTREEWGNPEEFVTRAAPLVLLGSTEDLLQ
jgi:hypothetical protein